jgi:TRAP-type mannitol/chloroaromatic compound transport system substrate-binding protein
MLINQDEWDAATDQQKALINTTCTAATMMGLTEGEYKNGTVLQEFQEKGVQADQIPRDILVELQEVTREVLEEEAANDADFKRVYESQREFQEAYKVWDKRAYLPADLGEEE